MLAGLPVLFLSFPFDNGLFFLIGTLMLVGGFIAMMCILKPKADHADGSDSFKVRRKQYGSVSSELQKADSLDGHAFEHYVARLLPAMGFTHITVTQGSGDYGVDVIAYDGAVKIAIQCKLYGSPVGVKAVQEVYAGKAHYHADLAAAELFFHIGKVHAPHAVCVTVQGGVDDLVAAVLEGGGEADVGRAVDENFAARGAQGADCTHHAAQHTVFIADVLFFQVYHSIMLFLPSDDQINPDYSGHHRLLFYHQTVMLSGKMPMYLIRHEKQALLLLPVPEQLLYL